MDYAQQEYLSELNARNDYHFERFAGMDATPDEAEEMAFVADMEEMEERLEQHAAWVAEHREIERIASLPKFQTCRNGLAFGS